MKCVIFNNYFYFRSLQNIDVTKDFLSREREEQLKRESVQVSAKVAETVSFKDVHDEPYKVSENKAPVSIMKQTETSYSETRIHGPTVITKTTTTVTSETTSSDNKEQIKKQSAVSESKFDVSKIRTDTLGHFDIGEDLQETKESKKFVPKDLDLKETHEITKEQVKPVIDDILQRGTIVAASRSPIQDKDIKMVTKDLVETEKRSYDAKAPHKEERRHSCVSPAISLERIAESEVEMEEEINKFVSSVVKENQKITESKSTIKKSDSAMKQMADNIEIIIKQASEEVDLSSEEPVVETEEPQDIAGQVSVDSIIEEAVTTVEEYYDKNKDKTVETEIRVEETKKVVTKERPILIKSLSRDSGEVMIMPKKKHARTFSVQSSPDEVEEQIYTDSESGNCKNMVSLI